MTMETIRIIVRTLPRRRMIITTTNTDQANP